MRRLTDRLAAAGVLALAGYAVVQLVRDVRAMRYVDEVLEGLGPEKPRGRVLPWDEAVATVSGRPRAAGGIQPHYPSPMGVADATRARDWPPPAQARLIFTEQQIARDVERVIARRTRRELWGW